MDVVRSAGSHPIASLALRRFFEVDAESIVLATLHAMAEKGQVERGVVAKAIPDLGVDPEKLYPEIV